MKNRQEHRAFGRLVDFYAAGSVPDSLDLWPRIEQALARRDAAHLKLAGPLRPRWSLALLGVSVLLAAFLALAGVPGQSQPSASAQAAEALNAVARVAAAQPLEQSVIQNTYRYQKSKGLWMVESGPEGQRFTALVPFTREFWVAPDGSGRIREQKGQPVFPGPRERANWEAAGSPSLTGGLDQDFGANELTYEDFSRLPVDPAALAAALRPEATKPSGPPPDVETFILVGDHLREPGAPPQLRAALYQVASRIPGVELIGATTDHAGRQGVAVGLTTDYWEAKERFILIFDPKTSALLEEQQVLLERASWIDAQPPALIGYGTYLESKVVSQLP